MAAQPFSIFNKAKKKIGNASINLATGNYRISLLTTAPALTLSVFASIISLGTEIPDGNGYSTSGKPLASRVWTVSPSAIRYMFDAADVIWTATGGNITNIKVALIWLSAATTAGRHLVCRASLTSTAFTLSTNNTLTIQFNNAGIFTMV